MDQIVAINLSFMKITSIFFTKATDTICMAVTSMTVVKQPMANKMAIPTTKLIKTTTTFTVQNVVIKQNFTMVTSITFTMATDTIGMVVTGTKTKTGKLADLLPIFRSTSYKNLREQKGKRAFGGGDFEDNWG
jgi:hypothetical protein